MLLLQFWWVHLKPLNPKGGAFLRPGGANPKSIVFFDILEMPLFVSSAVTPAVQFADLFAGIVRHYYENELDQKEPGTEFQEWLVELFTKLHNLTENNFIPKSHYLEYGFQKIGKNFSYPVSEKFTTSDYF